MSEAQALAFWSELRDAVARVGELRQPPAWRRRRCGEMTVSTLERRAMQAFFLMNGDTYTAIARRFRRDRHYIGRWLWDAEFRAFYAQYRGLNDRSTSKRRGRTARELAGAAAA